MSKKIRSAIALVLLAVMVIGWLPPVQISAAADTSAVGELVDSYVSNKQTFALTADSRIFVVSDQEPTGDLLQTAQLIQRQFAADGRPSATPMDFLWGDEGLTRDGDIVLCLDDSVDAEGYILEVGEQAKVRFSDVRGLLYGANMLQKHLRYADSNTIQGFTCADTPDTKQRAVSLDCGRKYYTKDWICNFIREMSWMGYNALQFHFSDDSGFRFDLWDSEYYTGQFQPANDFSWICGSNYTSWTLAAYKNDKDKGKYLTTAEVVEILRTAAEYHIEIIPCFDSPSHLDYLTWTYEKNYDKNPDYSFYSTYKEKTYYAKDVDGVINYTNSRDWSTDMKWPYYSAVNVKKAHAKAFVFELYIDIANFFKEYAGSNHISVGADEVQLSTSNISSSYKYAWGFPDFVNYINELNTLLNDKGYTMRMYNDFMGSTSYNATSYEFADNIQIQYWDSPFNPSSKTATNHTQPVSYYVNEGRIIYNCIQTGTYYALRKTNTGSDARSVRNRQWTFYHANEESIWDEWYSADISEHGDYSEDTPDVPAANLGGAYFLIWGDYACVSTEKEIWNGCYDTDGSGEYYSLRDRMWSNITKQWNWDVNETVSFEDFAAVRDAYGDHPGIGTTADSCAQPTQLPAGTDIRQACDHSYEETVVREANCQQTGLKIFTCSSCGLSYEEESSIGDHSYTAEVLDATCTDYERIRYTCVHCGQTHLKYPEELYTQWQEEKPEGVDDSLIQIWEQYRYSDRETAASSSVAMEGFTQTGFRWNSVGGGSVEYVDSWPSGFSTSNSLYSKYNNKSDKATAYEEEDTKRVIDSDKISGYLYYHWCYSNSYYSVASKSGSYTVFHAYYSTVAPSNYTCDTSDMSYKTSNTSCCTNSNWFFVANVYTQSYTDYEKEYTFERWGDWSEWSDVPVEATEDRKVEKRTLYRYVDGTYAPHTFDENGACTLCGAPCDHSFRDNVCLECGYAKPEYDYYLFGWINGENYACEENAADLGEYKFVDGQVVVFFTEDSYVGIKASNNESYYMTDGWQGFVSSVTLYNTQKLSVPDKLFVPGGTEVTFTLTDNGDDTYLLSYVAVECGHASHTQEGVCTVCGDPVEHSYDKNTGFCICGLECVHNMVDGSCTLCGKECVHVYQNNVCTLCGQAKPQFDYYLFGWINGANYACEEDFANLGEYKFVDGKLEVRFASDSYVAVKASDNNHWYMTSGWQGNVTSAVLYNTKSLNNADKLFVPGGKLVTFTLTDNGDDTYVLSYEASCPHDSHDQNGICAACGETVLHSFKDNVCTLCGYEKTQYRFYYLFGWINGRDYADKDDRENLGDYQFVKGKLVAYFTEDSYVGIKTPDNLYWYMTDGYQGNATSVTLYNSEAIATEDKLFVPGKMMITFTLVDNGDDTYVLSYTAEECPHGQHGTNGICSMCGATVPHHFYLGYCDGCGKECEHDWDAGDCGICHYTCPHEWDEMGHCSICSLDCIHRTWTDGECDECGFDCVHSWVEGQCSICGMICDHSWEEGICQICGLRCTHTYQNNICTNCGFHKPETDYHLSGVINGADYAWGTDAANLGDYVFVDGTLTVIFRQESYIALKAANNSGWYVTDGDQGQTDTAVLYNVAAVEDGQLLWVPGGMKVTFTLVDNGDDTLTLSYTAVECPHESHLTTGECVDCGKIVDHAYSQQVTEPTCTEGGYTVHTCQVCGHSFTDSAVEATGHSYECVTVEATCTEDGLHTYTCHCGDSYTEVIEATGHSYECVTVEATCIEDGLRTYTCHCGDSYTEVIDATGHDYECVTVDATCTEDGLHTYTCHCGDSYTEVIEATGHSYECVTVDATCTEDGSSVYTCHCGDSYTEILPATGHSYGPWELDTVPTCEETGWMARQCQLCQLVQKRTVAADGHSYVDGSCEYCGEAEPVKVIAPKLEMDYPTLSFEGEIMYNLYYTVDDMSFVAELGLITFSERLYEGTMADAVNVYPGYSGADGSYMSQSAGIAAKNLADTVFFKVYAKLTDGSYVYSEVVGYNAVAYAKSILKNSQNDYMRRLVVAMINYGAEAQKFFSYNTDSLMNSFLTEEQQAMISGYEPTMIAPLVAVDPEKAVQFVYNDGDFARRYNSVSFDGAFSINYYFTAKGKPDNGMKFYYWNLADYNKATVLTPENATGTMDMVEGENYQFWGQVPNIAAKQMDETVFVAGVYELDGQRFTTGVLAYSLGAYCAKLALDDTSDQQAFSSATAVYGYYAKEYFANL